MAGEMTIKVLTRRIVFDVASEGRGEDRWGWLRSGLTADTGVRWNYS